MNIMLRKNNIFIYCVILLLALFVSLRGDTSDTSVYIDVFKNISSYFSLNPFVFYNNTYMELGYGVLCKIVSLMRLNYVFLFFIISFLTFYFIKKTSDLIGVNSFFVFLCYLPTFFPYHQLMQIRQGLAISVTFYLISLFILKNQSIIKKVILIALAISFHVVSIATILCSIFLSNSFIENKLNKINIVVRCFLLFTIIVLLSRLVQYFNLFDYISRGSSYANSEYSSTRSIFHPVNLRAMLLLFFFLILSFKNKFFDYFLLIFTVGVAIRLGFSDFLIVSGRVGTAFTFSEIFIIPLILKYRFSIFSSFIFIICYFFIHLYFILIHFQLPTIIEDYFRPLSF